MLKRIEIEGYGPYVCGRTKSASPPSFPPFTEAFSSVLTFSDIDSIRSAAKSHPIYSTISNILGNDKFGVCACVAPLKMQALIDCAAGKDFRAPTIDDVFWLYRQFNPDFDPNTGAGDNGCNLGDVINFWIKNGLYADGYGKIKGAYAVNAANPTEVLAALKSAPLFVGCDLPDEWPKNVSQGCTWGVEGPPDPNAGHATFWYGGNSPGVFDSTWGLELTILWPAVAKYFSAPTGEVYAVIPGP